MSLTACAIFFTAGVVCEQAAPGQLPGNAHTNSFGAGFEYSRTGNPTRGAFERQMAAVENGQFCVAFASGMAASSAVIHLVKTGDHVVCIDDVYGGTQRKLLGCEY